MTRNRCFLAVLSATILAADASAQFFLPPPVIVVPVVVPNGIGFQYGSRRLKIDGFFGTGGYSAGVLPIGPAGFGPAIALRPLYPYPSPYYLPVYGVVDRRTIIHIVNPPGYGPIRRGLAPYSEDIDVSGIDLDLEPAARIWGKKPDPGKINVAQNNAAKKVEQARVAPPGERLPAPKQEKQEKMPAPPAPAKPKVEPVPVPEWKRQLDNGITAFLNEDYGIAILRFRQLADADPPLPRAPFLLAQAYLAVGKYREAVQAIQRGLQRQKDWPLSGFRPKTELYGNDAEQLQQHVNALELAQRRQPKNADYLFLLGYIAWFDGQRDAAIDYFRQSRALAADPQWQDLFLQAAAGKVVAK